MNDSTSQFYGAPERQPGPPKKRRTGLAAVAGLAVVAVMGVGGYALMTGTDDGPANADAATGAKVQDAADSEPTATFDSAYAFGTQTDCRYLANIKPDKPATDAAECGVRGVHYDIAVFDDNDDRDQYLQQAGPIAKAFGMEYDLLVGDRFTVSPSDTSDIGNVDYDTFSDVFGGDVQHIGSGD